MYLLFCPLLFYRLLFDISLLFFFCSVVLCSILCLDLRKAYTQLWMSLSGEMVPPKRALSKLDRYFSASDPSRHFVVLLVDELDYMVREGLLLSCIAVV